MNQSGKNHSGAYTPDSRFCAKIRISIAALLRTVQKHSWSRVSSTKYRTHWPRSRLSANTPATAADLGGSTTPAARQTR